MEILRECVEPGPSISGLFATARKPSKVRQLPQATEKFLSDVRQLNSFLQRPPTGDEKNPSCTCSIDVLRGSKILNINALIGETYNVILNQE